MPEIDSFKKLMKKGRVWLYIGFGLLWASPLIRGIRFMQYTFQADAVEQSINSNNDYSYAKCLLVSYAVGVTASAGLVWLLDWTKEWKFWPLVILAAALTAGIIGIQPEQVITLFPVINPLWLSEAFGMLGISGIAIAVIFGRPCKLQENN